MDADRILKYVTLPQHVTCDSLCVGISHVQEQIKQIKILHSRVKKAVYFLGKSSRRKYIEGIWWKPHWEWMMVTDTDRPSQPDA